MTLDNAVSESQEFKDAERFSQILRSDGKQPALEFYRKLPHESREYIQRNDRYKWRLQEARMQI